jgi:hypothetical protein
MAVTKFRLVTHAAVDDFFQDARLLGITSRTKEYQLCWEVNRTLGFQFKMNNELEVMLLKKKKKCFFTVYECQESMRFTVHYLYSNHYKGEYLLPELKHIDYIWLVKGNYYSDEEIRWLIEGIRKIAHVQLVTILRPGELKSRENLIL